jgi:hypothetical protein
VAVERAERRSRELQAVVEPAWEALRWAGLRVARAEYELDRLVEERLSGAGQRPGG